jgi:4-hydroxybenzoate polyprenyltransferase
MMKPLSGIWQLTRFKEYVSFVIITTLLGAAAGQGSFGWLLIRVLVANWLAVGFAFMINDVEDAPDDALNPAKALRNPISAGTLSPRIGRLLSYLVAALAALLYAAVGLGPFLAGLACLILAYLYSWRPIRLKTIPLADLVSHAALLAGLQFLTAYLAFGGGPGWQWILPLGFVVAISLYGQLFNELRDFDGDLKAGVTHTASYIGRRAAHQLMMAWLGIGGVLTIVSLFVIRLIPAWVLILAVILACFLSWLRLRRSVLRQPTIALHQSFQKPVEVAAAIALMAWFAGPSAMALLSFARGLASGW